MTNVTCYADDRDPMSRESPRGLQTGNAIEPNDDDWR
jgi:hypothetical protein